MTQSTAGLSPITVVPSIPRTAVSRATSLLHRAWYRLRWAPRLGFAGPASMLHKPLMIVGPRMMSIGAGVTIWPHARLEALAPADDYTLVIGDNTVIQPFVHIGATVGVRIGRGALLASHVYISDHDHDYSDPDDPVVSNGRLLAAPVSIGDYVWLGERACILKGVTIGDGAIVGAGSIVTKSIPPRCIAVGTPARVVKRWDDEKNAWVKA